MQWTNDGPADLARLTTKVWRAVIVACRLLLVMVVLLAGWTHWLDAQGQLAKGASDSLVPLISALSLTVGLCWPYLLLPISPRRLVRVNDGFVLGETVLGTRRVAVDGLKLTSFWFPLTKNTLDGIVFLLRDPRGRTLLLLDANPNRSTEYAVLPDSQPSIDPNACELPPLRGLIEPEVQRPITTRERVLGWFGAIGVLAVSLYVIYLMATAVFGLR